MNLNFETQGGYATAFVDENRELYIKTTHLGNDFVTIEEFVYAHSLGKITEDNQRDLKILKDKIKDSSEEELKKYIIDELQGEPLFWVFIEEGTVGK